MCILVPAWFFLGTCLTYCQEKTSDAKASAAAQSDSGAAELSSPELNAIREQSAAFVAAFNANDAAKIAELWTEEGEYVDAFGRRFVGRQEIEKAYADFFAEHPKAQLQLTIDSLHLVSSTVAMEDGRAVADSVPPGAGIGKYTAVHVKADGKWLMASVRDSWIEAPVAAQSASDLQWLVGKWVAEEHGVRMEMACRWIASNRFLERSYTNTQLDGSTTSGLQVIGWSPMVGQVQSWDFSPDGGHAVGTWYPTEGGWIAEVQGTTGEGIPTFAINRIVRLDDNAHVWQSTERSIGGVDLGATDEVVIKRQPAE